MNLVIARGCSNSCPYCFETSERLSGRRSFITMENVAQFSDWARDSHLESLQLVGGEPFLHSELGPIVSTFRQFCPGTRVTVLTGGIFDKRLLDSLSPDDVGLAFNINEARDYKNPKHFFQVLNNVDIAIRKGFRVGLSFNVWRLDFDTSFMPALAHRLARANFRWAVANPQRGFQSTVVEPMQYRALAERCFAMLQEAAQFNIEARLDCPVPLCFFSDSQLGWVRQYHPGTALRIGCCGPALDVTPELEVIRCFGLSRLARVKLMDFQNERDLGDWFLARLEPQLLRKGCFSQCNECAHFNAGRCYGGCLAWHECAVDTQAQSGAFTLATGMGKAIDDGNPDLAVEQYEKATYWSKAAMPTFEAAVAAFRLGKRDEAFRYAAYAQDMTPDLALKEHVRDLMKSIPPRDMKATLCPPTEKVFPPFVLSPKQVEAEVDEHRT